MSDRHEKWVRVPPGTVIPAGQPYRAEAVTHATEFLRGATLPWKVTKDKLAEYFIDSSWKPPLVLPTVPSVIRAVVNGRSGVLLTGPHPSERKSELATWDEFDNHFHYPDEISSFEVLWTEEA